MHNDDVIDQLRSVSETLAERAIALLREAVSEGHTKAPANEKKVTQARRAVEKAIHLLEGLETESFDD